MAHSLPRGLTAAETAFLCEMELITIIPRQRLDSIPLLSGPTSALRPPHRVDVTLWLALLLKKQKRANIVPPPWMTISALSDLVRYETTISTEAFSPPPPLPSKAILESAGVAKPFGMGSEVMLSTPFLPSCTAQSYSGALPYHWLEVGQILLGQAADDVPNALEVRGLLKDLQEVRAAKMRSSVSAAELTSGEIGGVMSLRGVGGMELAENRGVVGGMLDGIRKLGMSTEISRRGGEGVEDEDEEMEDDGL